MPNVGRSTRVVLQGSAIDGRRRLVTRTDRVLGLVKRCARCGEWWPLDDTFYRPHESGVLPRLLGRVPSAPGARERRDRSTAGRRATAQASRARRSARRRDPRALPRGDAAELDDLLVELRPTTGQLGAFDGGAAPARPALDQRRALWDLAIKLGRELAAAPADHRVAPGGSERRARRAARRRSRSAPRLTAAQRRALGERSTRSRRLPAPRWETPLPATAVGSWGPLVVAFARDELGIELDRWQMRAITRALAVDAGGRLVHREYLVSTGRQSGKTALVRALIGWALTTDVGPAWSLLYGLAYNRPQARIPYAAVLADLAELARRVGPESARRARADALSRDPLGDARLAPRVPRHEPRGARRAPRLLDRSRALR